MALDQYFKEILNVCVLGHLEHDVMAEFQGVV